MKTRVEEEKEIGIRRVVTPLAFNTTGHVCVLLGRHEHVGRPTFLRRLVRAGCHFFVALSM